jgi:uncharacterized protein (TIGR02118 family)
MGNFKPVPDGETVVDDPYLLFETRKFNDTLILVGTNSDEGGLFLTQSFKNSSNTPITQLRAKVMIKVIMVVKRKSGISREEFYKYWKNVHGPLVAKHIPYMKKYVQNHFVDIPGNIYEGDGIIETWYDDIESFQKSMAYNTTAEARDLGLGEDWAKIADMSEEPKMWVVEEHLIKDDLHHDESSSKQAGCTAADMP